MIFTQRSTSPRPRRSRIGLRTTTAVVAGALLVALPTSASGSGRDGDSLQDLQRQRASVQAKKATQASQVNALKASDAKVTSALQALNANVSAQQDRVEEAERAVAQAEADQKAAEEAQAQAQRELDTLKAELRESAVNAYVSLGSAELTATVGVDNVNDALNKRTLVEMRSNEGANLVERYRSVQEDLETLRAAAVEANDRARENQAEVTSRMQELKKAQAQQQAFAAQVEQRLESALAEAQSLASLDKKLSQSISAKQQAIAQQLAAQRAAQAARNNARVSSNRSSFGGGSSGGGGGGGVPPVVTGSGEIVNVGGIRVHRSIAGNLQSLLSAASAAGIHFGGGGFRDPAGQIAVRRSNCGGSNYAIYQMPASSCRPPTARPGSSMHERGLAIDFTQGGSTLTRGSSGYHWLRANAASFGFHNLPSEPWHWSTNGN